jgi:hypothetical protein
MAGSALKEPTLTPVAPRALAEGPLPPRPRSAASDDVWREQLRGHSYNTVSAVTTLDGRTLHLCRHPDGQEYVLDANAGTVVGTGPALSPAEAFAAALQSRERWGFAPVPPEHLEREAMVAQFPSLARTLPPLPPPFPALTGPLGSMIDAREVRLDLGSGATVAELLPLVGRFAALDLGEHGDAAATKPGPMAKWTLAMATEGERSALAVQRGHGLVWGRYELPPRLAAERRERFGHHPDPARVDVVGLLSGDKVHAVVLVSLGGTAPF